MHLRPTTGSRSPGIWPSTTRFSANASGWNHLRVGEDVGESIGRVRTPKPWTALAPGKIFGVLLQSDTVVVCVLIGVGLGLVSGVVMSMRLL